MATTGWRNSSPTARASMSRRFTLSGFLNRPTPDNAFAFTNLFKYYSKWGNRMDANVTADDFVYPLLIKSSGKSGIAFHAHLLKLGRLREKFIDNAIKSWYGKNGPIQSAWNMFDQMSEKSVADWNSAISASWN
ncbi:OLC1v1038799C1 [Oldenlandia corymbosa var. corymbosa]|uniref:OLC1v1038799C1 n=1 Tax=Oldenlandia corymbosa var. corymbosa TaxID=529605 RepID=A0AAV1D271_OLDCO|nr:OLC1v1038799C1 [Oldenlandia corymbosa var. corymbosa]